MSRDRFVFLCKWADALKGCDAKVKAEVYDGIVEYVISGTVPGFKPCAQMAFNFIKQELDESISKSEAISAARRSAGKLGGDKMVGNENASKTNKNNQNQTNSNKNNQNQSNENEAENPQTPTTNNNKIDDNKDSGINHDNTSPVDNHDNTSPIEEKEKEKEKVGKENENETENPPSGNPPSGIEDRKNSFGKSLIPFIDKYGKEMTRAFFDYWTEFNKSKTKMRFELQKTWETSKRLALWARRDSDFPRQHVEQKGKIESNDEAINHALKRLSNENENN